MVKLTKTRFWDIFSTVSYFLAILATLLLIVALATLLKTTPQLLGLA